MSSIESWPVVIIGAGAAGLHCAAEAGLRGCRVLLLERGRKPGRKILISGGGRCNFTNLHNDPRKHYLSANPHFCISALKRYPASAFIELVEQAGIAYHEKTLGQLFCDGTAGEIVDMLLRRCRDGNVTIRYNVEATKLVSCRGIHKIDKQCQVQKFSLLRKRFISAFSDLKLNLFPYSRHQFASFRLFFIVITQFIVSLDIALFLVTAQSSHIVFSCRHVIF